MLYPSSVQCWTQFCRVTLVSVEITNSEKFDSCGQNLIFDLEPANATKKVFNKRAEFDKTMLSAK